MKLAQPIDGLARATPVFVVLLMSLLVGCPSQPTAPSEGSSTGASAKATVVDAAPDAVLRPAEVEKRAPVPGGALPADDPVWQRVTGLPDTCSVHLARDPAKAVRPLRFENCPGEAQGCRHFVAEWSKEPANTFFGRHRSIASVGDANYLVSTRREMDSKSRITRELHVVERIDGDVVFALALEKESSPDCGVSSAIAEQGILVSVIPARAAVWAHVGQASWESPEDVSWRRLDEASLAKLDHSDGWLAVHAINRSGIWIGEGTVFSLLRPGKTVLTNPRDKNSRRPFLGAPIVLDEGAVALFFEDPIASRISGIASVDENGTVAIVRPTPEGRRLSNLVVEPETQALVWMEMDDARSASASGTELLTAPFELGITKLAPRTIATLSRPSFQLNSTAARHGLVALTVSNPYGPAFVVRMDDGTVGRVAPPAKRTLNGVAGFTGEELWFWTGREGKVGGSGIARYRLDSIRRGKNPD